MESVFLDSAGRMVLPKRVRKKFATKTFGVEVVKNTIILKPKKTLADLFGKAPGLDIKGFHRERKEEIKREDTP